ncbi:MAG: hypothetical protein ACP5R3_01335 [Thermoplasmata archaeon]|nr:hypothetical protein [Thermoplasmata archaeon]
MQGYRVFTPAGISSFFIAHTKDKNGRRITDPLKIGAMGGGISISNGIHTRAIIDDENYGIKVYINGKEENAITTIRSVDLTLKKFKERRSVTIYHDIEIPIGSGFGTSASGAFGAALATAGALGRPISYMDALKIAHISDVLSLTGLGTAEGFISSGIVLIKKAGGPETAKIDKIPINDDLFLIALYFGPIKKEKILSSDEFLDNVNRAGKIALKNILKKPDVKTFMFESRMFAYKSGLGDEEMLEISDDLVKKNAIGATQNMIGRSIHSIVHRKNVKEIIKIAKNYTENIIVSKIFDCNLRKH